LTARRPVLLLLLAVAIAFVWSGSALAVSPQRIYKDLADNGKLDGKYRRADVVRAFNLQRVVKVDKSATVPVRRPAATTARVETKRSASKVPFTGLDLALLTVGGGPLLLIGVGLRRRLAPASSHARVVGG
jgi:hypothetical protein